MCTWYFARVLGEAVKTQPHRVQHRIIVAEGPKVDAILGSLEYAWEYGKEVWQRYYSGDD
jgi:hypothetical protein